ncbi:MAG TPA: hypothetical protein VG096_14920 [Bryobacteraceae bacterium]|jgi:hypothetical protein|nr:hypothetical protein [Bryobacteraceae bacterium]
MKAFSIGRCALIGIFSVGAPLFAQATTPVFSQAVTTGIVTFSLNQSAQLNVLNLSPVPVKAGTAPVCPVQLEFRDAQNNLLKQLLVSNVPPGDAASLLLDRTEAPNTSVSRFAIRGVVRTGLVTPSASPIALNPVRSCRHWRSLTTVPATRSW